MDRIITGTLALGWLFAALGCGLNDPKYIDYADDGGDGTTPPTTDVTYTTGAKALLDSKCATSGCHVAGAQSPNLSAFDTAKAAGSASSKRIVANTMPTSGPLSAADKATFKAWVDAGYPQ